MIAARRGLYALVDTSSLDARGIDVLAFARAVLAGGPALLQLRAKNADDARTVTLLRAIAPLAKEANVPFFANDRPDLAAAAAVSGVHVGQTDETLVSVRRRFPGLALGVSTHDEEQLIAALAQGPAYIAFGPVFPTVSKCEPDPVVGLTRLAVAVSRAGSFRVVAIGGIGLGNAAAIARTGAFGAVIGALLPDEGDGALTSVTRNTRALAALLGADP